MDDFKSEKPNNTMQTNDLISAIFRTFRIVEFFVALLLLTWFFTRLPCAFKLFAEYLLKLSAIVGNPLFVFAVSNAIIAALLAISGRLSAADNADRHATGIYEEFLKNRSSPADAGAPPRSVEWEVEFRDKEVISETRAAEALVDRMVDDRTCAEKNCTCAGADSSIRTYRRSKSENWKTEEGKELQRRFRRSETEKKRDCLYPQDKLSSEEFQRTIESFIAKQMRFLKEESSAIVVQNP